MKKALALLMFVAVLTGAAAHQHRTDLSGSDSCAACAIGQSASTPALPVAAVAPPPRPVAPLPVAVPRGPSALRLLAVAPKTSPPELALG